MERSLGRRVRELAEWLRWSGYSQVARRRFTRNGAQRGQRSLRSSRGRLAPLRLLLTLGMPVVTTLLLLQVVSGAQAARASGCTWYRVQSGDTLGKIGARYGVSVKQIVASNHISNPDLIFPDQQLCIPTSGTADSSQGTADSQNGSPTSKPTAKGQEAFIALVMPYAQRAHEQTGWPLSVILAQWGVEQGWNAPSYTGYNWGNVAALPGEPTVDGIHVWGSPAAFAYARTPEDGLRYYTRVAALGFYTAVAPAAKSGGADAAARALGRSPWDAAHYTSRGDPGSALITQMQKYNLYQYDK